MRKVESDIRRNESQEDKLVKRKIINAKQVSLDINCSFAKKQHTWAPGAKPHKEAITSELAKKYIVFNTSPQKPERDNSPMKYAHQ